MTDSRFYPKTETVTLEALAEFLSAEIIRGEAGKSLENVASLAHAGSGDVAFLNSPQYSDQLERTTAGAVLLDPEKISVMPQDDTVAVLGCPNPYLAFARVAQMFHPHTSRMMPLAGLQSEAVHPDAKLAEDVQLGPNVVIGPGAEIGQGTKIGANTVIGHGCAIGRDCVIGPQSSIQYALIGDDVFIHPQVAIGQDGFGFAPDPQGHIKIPQLGRVIIQNNVELGAGCKIDRGALDDTVVGEGTKLDNLIHLAHNVQIGRHCFIAASTGVAGSTHVGDFVMIGGMVGIAGHLSIGEGAQITAFSGVTKNVAAGARIGGFPAKPVTEWHREIATLSRLRKNKNKQ